MDDSVLRNAMSNNIRVHGEPHSPRVKGLTMAWDQFLKNCEPPSGELFFFGACSCWSIVKNPHAHLEDLPCSKWDPAVVHMWSPPPELIKVRDALLDWADSDTESDTDNSGNV